MSKQKTVLIITHIYYRGESTIPLPGPYSSVAESLDKSVYRVSLLLLPMSNTIFRYFMDIFSIIRKTVFFNLKNNASRRIIIAIDPLSCLPLVFFRKIFNFRLIFYCVDFNRKRFNNRFLQRLYEMADKLSSQYSDQTWVISNALKNYKKNNYHIEAIYIPNSSTFNSQWYGKSGRSKKGYTLLWGGSVLTNQQTNMLFGILKKIQQMQPSIKIYLAPTNKFTRFEKLIKDYKLKEAKVYKTSTRNDWLNLIAASTVGLAIYDPDFDSTRFIEPIKIWEYMMFGISFIISGEVSLSSAIKQSGIAYILGPRNTIIDEKSLSDFLDQKNLQKLQTNCLRLAKQYDMKNLVEKALSEQL